MNTLYKALHPEGLVEEVRYSSARS